MLSQKNIFPIFLQQSLFIKNSYSHMYNTD